MAAIDCILTGDTCDTGVEKMWTSAMMRNYGIANRLKWSAVINAGDGTYDGAWHDWCVLWDAAGSWGDFNDVTLLALGNHDVLNPDGSLAFDATGNHIARWTPNRASTAWTVGVGKNNRYRFCVPTVPVKQNFIYRVKTAGTTGATEPNWRLPIEGGAMAPGKTVRDGTVVWECINYGADTWDYISSRTANGVMRAGSDHRTAARRSDSIPMRLMQSIHLEGWGAAGADPLNPFNEYGAIDLHGKDNSGDFIWRVYLLNTELEWGSRPTDTHTARGFGPAYGEAGIAVDSLQYKWFARDLADPANAKKQKIMVCHWPWFYLQNGNHPGMAAAYKLFMSHNGRIIVAGHQHHYARFNPVNQNQEEQELASGNKIPNGYAIQVVIGNGGHDASGTFSGADGKGTLLGRTPGGGLAAIGRFGASHLRLNRNGFAMSHLTTTSLTARPVIFDQISYAVPAL